MSAPEFKRLLETQPSDEANAVGVASVELSADGKECLAIDLSFDSYDAVVAAAFDGIRISLPADEHGKKQFVRLHPMIVFMFCVCLFAVQISALSCIVLDMDMNNVWGDKSSWEGYSESPERQMKLMVRSIMVAVLQMIVLKELLGSMRPICLLLNPVTWFELERPNTNGKGWPFKALYCFPICICAQFMQFFIAYYVLAVSMSVIILAHDVKEVIFNGLVVTFLADLDEYAWAAMSAVFHMDQKEFTEFQFKIRNDCEVITAREEARKESMMGWKFWFYHGKGGKISILSSLLIFMTLTFIYIRQLFMYVQAVDTGILPVARDVCSLYRGMKDPDSQMMNYVRLQLIDFFTLINYKAMLLDTIDGHHVDCFSDDYRAGPFDQIEMLMEVEWSKKVLYGGVVVIIVLFAVPQLLYANFQKIIKFLGNEAQPQKKKN